MESDLQSETIRDLTARGERLCIYDAEARKLPENNMAVGECHRIFEACTQAARESRLDKYRLICGNDVGMIGTVFQHE